MNNLITDKAIIEVPHLTAPLRSSVGSVILGMEG